MMHGKSRFGMEINTSEIINEVWDYTRLKPSHSTREICSRLMLFGRSNEDFGLTRTTESFWDFLCEHAHKDVPYKAWSEAQKGWVSKAVSQALAAYRRREGIFGSNNVKELKK